MNNQINSDDVNNFKNKLINNTKSLNIIIPLFEGPKPLENWT